MSALTLFDCQLNAFSGKTYDIYLTGTNPQHTRFYLINADEDDRVRIAIYYSTPQRLDVFADSTFIYPENAEITDDGGYNLQVRERS